MNTTVQPFKVHVAGEADSIRDMSQTNRLFTGQRNWPDRDQVQARDTSAPSTALRSEESHLSFEQNSPETERKEKSNNTDSSSFEAVNVNLQFCAIKKHCRQTAAEPQELQVTVEDCPAISSCATISDTARELCKAVSVSLGLTNESSDAGSDMDTTFLPCAAGEIICREDVFSAGAVALSCSGGQGAAAGYKCSNFEAQQQRSAEHLDNFRSSAAAAQHFRKTRTSAEQQNFTACCESAAEITDDIISVRAAHCPYDPIIRDCLPPIPLPPPPRTAHTTAETQRRRRIEDGDEEGKQVAFFLSDHFNVQVKCEDGSHPWTRSDYTFNDKHNTQFWGSRQCVGAHGTRTNSTFTYSPYERNDVPSRHWYPRSNHPNNTGFVKTEVGEWLDVNDTR